MPNENKVELLGYYGGDETHAASAWCSTDRHKVETDKDRIPALLRRLAQDGHNTPFEKSYLHFLVTCETASHIHLLKHRIGVSVNGESARYKELKESKFYIPQDWHSSLADGPMGGTLDLWALKLYAYIEEGLYNYHECLAALTPLLGRKRAKESARYFLTYANQLTLDVGFNWRSFIHFQGLRNEDHAQLEIHQIAQQMLDLVKGIPGEPFKYTLEAFGL